MSSRDGIAATPQDMSNRGAQPSAIRLDWGPTCSHKSSIGDEIRVDTQILCPFREFFHASERF